MLVIRRLAATWGGDLEGTPKKPLAPVSFLLATGLALGASSPLTFDTIALSGPLTPSEVGVIYDGKLTADGSRVVYRADGDSSSAGSELFSSPTDGSSSAIRLAKSTETEQLPPGDSQPSGSKASSPRLA